MPIKDYLEAKLQERRTERAVPLPDQAPRTDGDPELEAALARVARGELAAARRSRYGALIITHKSDPANSPAAPEASSGGGA